MSYRDFLSGAKRIIIKEKTNKLRQTLQILLLPLKSDHFLPKLVQRPINDIERDLFDLAVRFGCLGICD